MLTYRFYIRNNQDTTPAYVEVDEPIGWDGVVFTLQRSDQFDGLENLYSDDLTFYGAGTDLLRDAFESFGFDAQLDCKIEFYCDLVLDSTIVTVINMLTYKRVGNQTTVKLEASSVDRKFKNRFETKVNFDDLLSIEGEALTPLEPFDLKLHSKLIRTSASIKELGDPIIMGNDSNAHVPLLYKFDGDLAGTNDVTSQNVDDKSSNCIITNGSQFIRNLEITAHFDISSYSEITTNDSGTTVFKFSGGYKVYYSILLGDKITPLVTAFIADIPATASTVPLTDTFDYTITIPLFPTMSLFIYTIEDYENTLPGDVINRACLFTYNESTEIDIQEDNQIVPSESSAYMIYEVFNRVCESITDQQNAFRSNFFGRQNSLPTAYDENGCGSFTALLNGLSIRKMLDKDGNEYPFIASFSDLYRSCNAIWNLGARVEQDDDGSYYIRVEPKEYFYDNTEVVFTIDSPADVETVVAKDLLFNDIEIGYEKWKIEAVNGIDEFNSRRNYSIPLLNVKNKLQNGGGSMLSPYITSGYVIETTRRLQYSSNPTTDSEFDNDNFIVCLNRTEVTSDRYSSPPASQSYGINEVSERDEAFGAISDVISSETSYNLRLSPGNMIRNWWNYLAPSVLLKPSKILKYQSGEGNTLMKTTREDDCSPVSGEINERGNVSQDQFKESNILLSALYNPVYISFDYPIDFGNFIAIKEGSNKLIRVNCDNTSYFGFIKELRFSPNNGSANFKILLSNCVDGGFDSGFDSGFEIGTC